MKKLLRIVVLGLLLTNNVNSSEIFLNCIPTKGSAYSIVKSKWIPFKASQDSIYKIENSKKKIYRLIQNDFIQIGHKITWDKDSIKWHDDFTKIDDTKIWSSLNRITGELNIIENNGPNSFSQKTLKISQSNQWWKCSKIDRKF